MPEPVARLLSELFDPGDLGGYWVSEDARRVTARIYVDGYVCSYTYELDEETDEYVLRGYNPLGRARL
jgi:hypothetical protein